MKDYMKLIGVSFVGSFVFLILSPLVPEVDFVWGSILVISSIILLIVFLRSGLTPEEKFDRMEEKEFPGPKIIKKKESDYFSNYFKDN